MRGASRASYASLREALALIGLIAPFIFKY